MRTMHLTDISRLRITYGPDRQVDFRLPGSRLSLGIVQRSAGDGPSYLTAGGFYLRDREPNEWCLAVTAEMTDGGTVGSIRRILQERREKLGREPGLLEAWREPGEADVQILKAEVPRFVQAEGEPEVVVTDEGVRFAILDGVVLPDETGRVAHLRALGLGDLD